MNEHPKQASSHHAAAIDASSNCQAAESRLRRRIVGAGMLFGNEVAHALTAELEQVIDHRADMATHLEREITDQRRTIEDQVKFAAERVRVIAEQAELIDRISGELEARFKRSGKPMPGWLTQVRLDFGVPF